MFALLVLALLQLALALLLVGLVAACAPLWATTP